MIYYYLINIERGIHDVVKSIFDIEPRVDFDEEYRRILRALNDAPIYRRNFWFYLDKIFTRWKYRGTAFDWQQYLGDIGIFSLEDCNDEEKFYVLQFIANMFLLIAENASPIEFDSIAPIATNISRLLEKMNYQLSKIEDKYIIVKRDADVDSVLENSKKISDYLLSYNDFAIENDIVEKKILLKHIFDYIEKNSKKYKGINNGLYKDISFIVNNFHVRHENEFQIQITKKDLVTVYDICFKMMIHLIRDYEIKTSFSILEDKYKK